MSEVYSSGITLFELLNNGVWTPRPSSRKVLLVSTVIRKGHKARL